MRTISTEEDLDELQRMTIAQAVLEAWGASGLFAALADGKPHRSAELPGDPRAIEITARVLVHLGLLVSSDDGLALSRQAQALWKSGALNRFGARDGRGELFQLPELLREGGPIRGPDGAPMDTAIGVLPGNADANRAFMDFLHRRSGDAAEEVARALAPKLRPAGTVVDLGGGHGRYAEALAAKGLSVTLFDQPGIVELAKERYGRALTYRAGDFMTDELGGPYDAALLSNIVHGLGPETNVALLSRVRDALAPGGRVMLKDFFLDDLRAFPEEAAFFGVRMLLHTREGRTYSAQEMSELARRAGFEREDFTFVPTGVFGLLTVRRKD
jgi:SAM-dependent methyltransferase